MTDEERDAYRRGQCDAYNAVFNAFTTAFEEGQDIHWLRVHIFELWNAAGGIRVTRGAL